MSNKDEAPILGVMLNESGVVAGVVTNNSACEGVPVVVIDQATDGLADDEIRIISPRNQPFYTAMTYRVGGVFEADFEMDDL